MGTRDTALRLKKVTPMKTVAEGIPKNNGYLNFPFIQQNAISTVHMPKTTSQVN